MRKRVLLLCCLMFSLLVASFPLSAEYKDFIEQFPNGKINWREGYVEAQGAGDIPDSGNTAAAMRAASVTARGNMLKIMKEIRLDGNRMITDISSATVRLKGFIRGAEKISDEIKEDTVEVVLRAPLKGVNGLSMEILENEKLTETRLSKRSNMVEVSFVRDENFVLIDARGTELNPALFPRILDPSGNILYSPDKVDREALKKKGIARYVVAEDKDKTVSAKNETADDSGTKKKESDKNRDKKDGEKRKKRRRGYREIKVKDPAAKGKLKANITVSEEDAKKILQAEKTSNVLSECRVIVVMDSEVGGIEGEMLLEERENFGLTVCFRKDFKMHFP